MSVSTCTTTTTAIAHVGTAAETTLRPSIALGVIESQCNYMRKNTRLLRRILYNNLVSHRRARGTCSP